MKKLVRNTKGFTLVELMIVVAIIGILAAIAIPQFAAYRIRGFNSSAQSDTKNLSTTQAAFFADWSSFGVSLATAAATTFAAAPQLGAAGAVLLGGDANADGIALTVNAVDRGLGISLGRAVSLVASTPVAAAGVLTVAYDVVAKHVQGDTVYGMDSDATSVFQCPPLPAGGACIIAVGTGVAATPAVVNGAIDFPVTVAAGWVIK